MADLLLALTSPAARGRLRAALGMDRASRGRHRVFWVPEDDDLEVHVATRPWDVVVLDPVGLKDGFASVRRLRTLYPSVQVIAYGEFSVIPAQQILEWAREGICAALSQGIDDDPGNIAAVINRTVHAGPLTQLAEDAANGSDPRVTALLRCALQHATQPLTVAQVSGLTGFGSRTLRRVLAHRGLPLPGELVAWCRVLHAARLMDDPGRSTDAVANVLGFSSPSDLRRRLRRLTGLTPSELLDLGGAPFIVDLFKKKMRRNGAVVSDPDTIDEAGDMTWDPLATLSWGERVKTRRRDRSAEAST